MSEEENKIIARRFNDEVWDGGDEAALEELFAEDVVDHGAISRGARWWNAGQSTTP